MGNGALPHGPSYRAHPRLYHHVGSPRCSDAAGVEGLADMSEMSDALKMQIRNEQLNQPVPFRGGLAEAPGNLRPPGLCFALRVRQQ